MFKNYFKTALRNLQRNKIYSTINIAGMAVGMAAFWLIVLYVGDELSYDRSFKNADRICNMQAGLVAA
jgi:putative ABC transport system permease protein